MEESPNPNAELAGRVRSGRLIVDQLPALTLPTATGREQDAAAAPIVRPPHASDQEVRRLHQQIASARVAKELAQLDLEWERERQKYLLVTRCNPAGEIPERSTAIGFLVAGGIFALALMLGAVLVTAWLLLLLLPVVALTVLIVATGIHQYGRARAYQRGVARYLARRRRIESSCRPAIELSHGSGWPLPSHAAVAELIEQIAEERYQAAVASLDREWEIEQQKHYLLTRRGRRFIPTRQGALATAVGGVVFGAVMSATGTPPYFPSFGVVCALLGIGGAFYFYGLAQKYTRALSAYQSRREQLCRERFAGITPGVGHGMATVGLSEGPAELGGVSLSGDS